MNEFLVRHSGWLLVAATLLTAALVVPMLFMATDEIASTRPGGDVFDLQDEIDEKLASPFFTTAFIVESRDGDILTQAGLWELHQRQEALREADARGELAPATMEPRPLLAEAFDRSTGASYTGLSTLVDAVQQTLRLHPALNTTLEEATDDQVKFAVAQLLMSPVTQALGDQLSAQATSERRELFGQEVDYWRSPALLLIVQADNEALGGGAPTVGIATDETGLNKERFARNVQAVLRGGEQSYRLWGLAIDQTLEAQEQGVTAGLFIMFTVVAALAIVGISLRSYWAAALTAVGIGALMVWLKGISALVGIKGGLIVDLIVPIAMVSLGVDFAVHAARRYKEERRNGYPPQRALAVGMAGVLGALFLAMVSDSIAFLSNVPSGIEAVVHFGTSAGIAVASAFVVLGVVLPLALMRIDQMIEAKEAVVGRPWALGGAAGVTIGTGAGVILLVALDAGIGVSVLAATALVFVGLPVLALARFPRFPFATKLGLVGARLLRSARNDEGRAARNDGFSAPVSATPRGEVDVGQRAHTPMESRVAAFVVALARRKAFVIPVAAFITIVSGFLAFRLEATFDVKDFFSPGSDLVVGLDKMDQHVADRGGESGTVYIRGDVTDPSLLSAIDGFIERLGANPYVGRDADGTASVFNRHVSHMVRLVMETSEAMERVEAETGVRLTDEDGNGFPDSREQARAVLAYITTHGVPRDSSTEVYLAEEVRSALYFNSEDVGESITVLMVGIPGTREQSIIPLARDALREDLAPLEAHPAVARAGLTGTPFVRDAELTAAVDTLRTSLPLAAAGAFVLLLITLRSVRYAIVTVIPIGLVVAWLYAVMEVMGFSLNFVTATIGAVSIGVGIDYSIHMTARFREEMRRSETRLAALERAGRGTGVALIASAGSSVAGFAIMGFAPMPLFSTYGILTATMIFLALAASLVVLPSLLVAVTRDPQPVTAPEREAVPHG